MKQFFKYIRKNIKFYFFLAILVIVNTSIGNNFEKGSREKVIAYMIVWGFVVVYAIIKAIKEVKRLKNDM